MSARRAERLRVFRVDRHQVALGQYVVADEPGDTLAEERLDHGRPDPVVGGGVTRALEVTDVVDESGDLELEVVGRPGGQQVGALEEVGEEAGFLVAGVGGGPGEEGDEPIDRPEALVHSSRFRPVAPPSVTPRRPAIVGAQSTARIDTVPRATTPPSALAAGCPPLTTATCSRVAGLPCMPR